MNQESAYILIVDDNKENIKLAGSILKDNGYKIAIAMDGKSALKIMETTNFDLVLLDVMMPEMDGLEVCKHIKAEKKWKEIPIIFLTAKNTSADLVNGFKAGGVDYISKPFNIDELLARVQTHIELKKSKEKLIELNATKDKLFSIIGHDLREPIGGIKSIIKLLITGIDLSDTENVKKILSASQKTANSSFDLLENLLTWAKSQRDEIRFEPEFLKLDEQIKSTLNLLSEKSNLKEITITQNISPETMILADKNMLSIILRNLLSNAIKFTKMGGEIIIEAEQKDDSLQVSVHDNGVGIPSSALDKLFKIIGNYSTYGTNNEKGSGLGLTLCKEIVEKHQGKIWVKSIEGQGSTFIFSLPNKK